MSIKKNVDYLPVIIIIIDNVGLFTLVAWGKHKKWPILSVNIISLTAQPVSGGEI